VRHAVTPVLPLQLRFTIVNEQILCKRFHDFSNENMSQSDLPATPKKRITYSDAAVTPSKKLPLLPSSPMRPLSNANSPFSYIKKHTRNLNSDLSFGPSPTKASDTKHVAQSIRAVKDPLWDFCVQSNGSVSKHLLTMQSPYKSRRCMEWIGRDLQRSVSGKCSLVYVINWKLY
jgi:hypothetical protein